MNTIPFDTLKFVEKLEAGGFTHSQAKAAAEAFAEATSQELATKADIASVIAANKSDIARLDSRLDKLDARLDKLDSRLDTGLQLLDQRVTIKLGGLIVAATGVILAAMRYLPTVH